MERQLSGAGRLDTVLGQQARELANRIQHGSMETGSAIASLSKELRAVVREVLEGAQPVADPLDELEERRRAKLDIPAG